MAAYSLGQMLASPVFAKWTNRIRQVRLPVTIAILFTLSGNFVYVFTEAFPVGDRKWVLLGTRFWMGIAGGRFPWLMLRNIYYSSLQAAQGY